MAADRPQVDVSFADPDSIVPIETRYGTRTRQTVIGGLLVALCFAIYLPTLRAKFIYLDDQTITDNRSLRSWGAGLTTIWSHPTVLRHYQPLAYSLLLLEFKTFGGRWAGGYLFINLLLHSLNVLLLWTLLKRLELRGALLAAILFAIHPLNVPAVAWASQQPLLWGAFFSFLMTIVWLRWAGLDPVPPDVGKVLRLPASSRGLYSLMVLLFVAAISCHVIAIALPLIFLTLAWWEKGSLTRAAVRSYLPLLAASLIWGIVIAIADARRVGVLGQVVPLDPLARIGDWPWYVVHYFAPVRLNLIYGKTPNTTLSGGISILLAIGLLVCCWPLRNRLGRGPLAAVAAILLLLLPTFFFRMDLSDASDLADPFFYLPSAILTVAVISGLSMIRVSAPRWMAPGIATGVSVLLIGMSLLRLFDFQDSQSFWTAVLQRNPKSVLALNHLGLIELEEHGDVAAARAHFIEALDVSPRDLSTLLNIAKSYDGSADEQTTLMRYREAQAVAPDDPDVHVGLAGIFLAQGNSERAMQEYQKVLDRLPAHYRALYGMGYAHLKRGEIDAARDFLNRAVIANPGEAAPYIELATIEFNSGELEAGLHQLELAHSIDPDNFRPALNFGAQLGAVAELPNIPESDRARLRHEAERRLRAAVELEPTSAEARHDLGVILLREGKVDEATFHLTKALQFDPKNAETIRALAVAKGLAGNKDP